MELTYRTEGDYLLPNLIPTENPKIGKFGMLRRSFLQKNRSGIYTGMLLKGTLNSHLEEVESRASEMLETLMTQMAKAENVTETLKASDQMTWVQRMNSIRNRAEEIVMAEVVYS